MRNGFVVYSRVAEEHRQGCLSRLRWLAGRIGLHFNGSRELYIRNRYGTWLLYCRADAPFIHECTRTAAYREYAAQFSTRYVTRRKAYLAACRACFQLNRFAKLPGCSPGQRAQIYALKNSWVLHLRREGFCTEATRVRAEDTVLAC